MSARALWRGLGVLFLASSGASCASYSSLRFAPNVQETQLRGEADDLQGHIAVAWNGVEDRDGVPELLFRVRVDNPGPTPFTLVPAEFELLDARLVSFGVVQPANLPLFIEAERSETFVVAFPVPAEKGLDSFDLTALMFNTRLQGGRWSWNTSFQRLPEESPHWGFGFGVSWLIH